MVSSWEISHSQHSRSDLPPNAVPHSSQILTNPLSHRLPPRHLHPLQNHQKRRPRPPRQPDFDERPRPSSQRRECCRRLIVEPWSRQQMVPAQRRNEWTRNPHCAGGTRCRSRTAADHRGSPRPQRHQTGAANTQGGVRVRIALPLSRRRNSAFQQCQRND